MQIKRYLKNQNYLNIVIVEKYPGKKKKNILNF